MNFGIYLGMAWDGIGFHLRGEGENSGSGFRICFHSSKAIYAFVMYIYLAQQHPNLPTCPREQVSQPRLLVFIILVLVIQ